MLPNPFHPQPYANDIILAAQLNHFAAHLPIYADRYQVTPAEVERVQHTVRRFTEWLDSHLGPTTDSSQQASLPVTPSGSPVATPDLATGFFALFWVKLLIRRLQQHPVYSLVDGCMLGLPQAPTTIHHLGRSRPRLQVADSGPEGGLMLMWRNRRDATVELEVCRDGYLWQVLTPTQRNRYVDYYPRPTHPTQWQYRARYCRAEWPAGQWGQVVPLEAGLVHGAACASARV